MLHHEHADGARAIEAPLNIAGAAAVEIGHRERQQLPHEEIQQRGINVDRGEAEQVLLHEAGTEHEKTGHNHAERGDLEQTQALFDDHPVHDDLGEYGKQQLQRGGHTRQQ